MTVPYPTIVLRKDRDSTEYERAVVHMEIDAACHKCGVVKLVFAFTVYEIRSMTETLGPERLPQYRVCMQCLNNLDHDTMDRIRYGRLEEEEMPF